MQADKTKKKKFSVSPSQIQFLSDKSQHKIVIKNNSLKSDTYEIINPNNQHFYIQSAKKFTLAPGMSKICYFSHKSCQNCYKDQFNKLRITSSDKQTLLIDFKCPIIEQKQIKLIQLTQQINFCEFNIDCQKKIQVKIVNISECNLKLSLQVQDQDKNKFDLTFQQNQIILLKGRQTIINGTLNFKVGMQFNITILIKITSEQDMSCGKKLQKINLIGQALVKNQVIKNHHGKNIQFISVRILNGTNYKGQFYIQNNFRKDAKFKLIPQIHSTTPNQFAQKWLQSQLLFSEDSGILKPHQTKKILFDIHSNLNLNDMNFIQKFSRLPYNDQFNISKMKLGKYFKKNIDINVKAIFSQSNKIEQLHSYTFKIRLTIVNSAIRIHYKNQFNKQIFQVYNETQIPIPFEIPTNPLYKAQPSKGIIDQDKCTITYEWKNQRPKSSNKMSSTIFPLAYGKCDLQICLPKFNLIVYNFVERQNLRPSSSTLKKSLGLEKILSSSVLKRPISAICAQMSTKKLNLVREQDFYKEIPKFIPISILNNLQLQKIIVSSGQKGNIISNSCNKQISLYFPQKGYLVLRPLKTYLLPYQLNLVQFILNDQQFSLDSPILQGLNTRFFNQKGKQIQYVLSTKQLSFSFNPNKKDYQIENSFTITNMSKQPIKAFLLTIDDQYFTSGEQDNKVIIKPQQVVNFKIKFIPNSPLKKQNKVIRKLQFLINGQKQQISCFGQLLPISCEYMPKNLKFIDCHYGGDPVTQNIILSNTAFNKLSYQIISPDYIQILNKQNLGTLTGKSSVTISVKFIPNIYLQNFKDHIRIIIRGSHIIYIPVFISTKKPDVIIHESILDFGQGIIGDILQANITVQNRNKTASQCLINLQDSGLLFSDDNITSQFHLNSLQKRILHIKAKVNQIGTIKKKFKKNIAQIPGFGAISNPIYWIYKGKQNILQINPPQLYHTLNIEQMQDSFKLKIKNLIGQKIDLKTQLIPQGKYTQTFIFSAEPNNWTLAAYSQKQITLNSLISDLQKLTQEERNYTLKIYRKGQLKAYTSIKFNIKLPTPKLIIEPSFIYFPLSAVNQWNHSIFRIINKGYKQIHFKIKKPSNINFQLQNVITILGGMMNTQISENKLTKLNNQAQVRISFRSKNPVSFQNHIIIEDNLGNTYPIKFYGLVTSCPLLLSDYNSGSPISAKSLPSMTSFTPNKTQRTFNSNQGQNQYEQDQQQIQHAKFFNFWIGTFMPQMKKQSSFHQYLNKPEVLIVFLEYFSISFGKIFGKQKPKLKDIIFQLRKLQIPLQIVNISLLQKNSLSEWNKFMFVFLSKKYINSECLKWVSKILNQNVQTYDFIYNNYKKFIVDILNSIFFKVFNCRINEFDRIVEKMDPFLGILYKINHKKHLIVSLNMLFYKFGNAQSQTILTEELTQKINLAHNPLYQKSTNWIISDSSPQILQVTGANTLHTNLSGYGYYFTLDKAHLQAQVKLSLKQKTCIAILNSTIFQKCFFINYDLQQIKPKIHNVTIECQDKFSQQWVLQYQAPIDSQYKIQFIGDPQFKSRFTTLGLVKTGKKIPITITYTPNNLNPHTATLTILNKHFTQIYLIKGKALFSQNIDYQKQIRLTEGKKHIQTIEIPWQCNNNQIINPTERNKKQQKEGTLKFIKQNSKNMNNNIDPLNLSLIQYSQKRSQLISHNLTVQKHSKKQNLVKLKLEYLFQQPMKKLSLLYQIANEDYTQSKIIRVVIRVVPKPIHIQAQIKCRLEQFIVQKIPIQNLSTQKQNVHIQFYKNNLQAQKYQKIKTKINTQQVQQNDNKQLPLNNNPLIKLDNQFKLNKTGKITVQGGQIEHIQLIYQPDSLYQASCQIRILFQESQNMIYYKFKGIPQFPSSYQDLIQVKCIAEIPYIFKIPLRSVVREATTYQVQTNIKQISGKQKIQLTNGQTVQYPLKFFSYHAGVFRGQILFSSPQMTLIYPLVITVQNNPNIGKKYQISSKVRHSTVLQLQLHNKSKQDILYDVISDHYYLICPQKFLIEKNTKKVLQITYLPFEAGNFNAQIKLYHPQMKQIVYQLQMNAQPYIQINQAPISDLLTPYVFVLPIKNKTNKDCTIERPNLPIELSFKNQYNNFPISLPSGKSIKIQLLFKQKLLSNQFNQKIIFKTDCIGEFIFICRRNFYETKIFEAFNIHYEAKKNNPKLTLPFSFPFVNQFNQKITFNVGFRNIDNSMTNNVLLKTPKQICLDVYEKANFEGTVQINTNLLQKIIMQIKSNKDIQAPLNLVAETIKNKIKYQFIFPIKLIKIYDSLHKIKVKANAYEMKKTLVNLSIVKDVSHWTVTDLDEDFIKSSFSFTSCNAYQNYLETIINKPLKYQGHVMFYNSKNQAQKIPLSIEIGEPKYETIIISSNVGQKAILQVQLKNGKGPFNISLNNNKQGEFDVQPTQGQFQMDKHTGQLAAKINFIYHPKDYSGIKRSKVVVSSQQGCYYFNLMGKFKTLKKSP